MRKHSARDPEETHATSLSQMGWVAKSHVTQSLQLLILSRSLMQRREPTTAEAQVPPNDT